MNKGPSKFCAQDVIILHVFDLQVQQQQQQQQQQHTACRPETFLCY